MNTTHQAEPPRAGHAREDQISPKKTQRIDNLMSLMAQAKEKVVLFELEAKPDSRVFIAGSFNGWNPSTHPLEYHPESGVFRATLLLSPGQHEYKFVVDGNWQVDARCPHRVTNERGTINSLLMV